ncbi:hypothetical protein [Kingella oralis]|uniref:hypothetical protein n=1 Tax=Kingella oralis TaxID=505 RepID=UPI0034E4CACD
MIPEIITDFLNFQSRDAADIGNFLEQYPLQMQKGLIACIYIGKEHMNVNEIQFPENMTTPTAYKLEASYFNFIHENEYTDILCKPKAKDYLNQLIFCAEKSDYDLNEIFNK